jgi:5-methyltetrahydropteroyltriglutamate--homocysteine methyltransferase
MISALSSEATDMPAVTTTRQARSPVRAEPVGSLLRDRRIAEQIDRMYAGQTSALRTPIVRLEPTMVAELNRLADVAIVELVQRQIDAGLDVITDGEVRRATFIGSLYDAIDGLGPAAEKIVARDDDGNVVNEWLNDPVVASPLRKVFSPAAEEATYLRSVTDFPFKITLPAPSYFLSDFVPIIGSSYANKPELVQDIVEIEKLLAAEAIAAGARHIQFDFPIYPALVATAANQPLGRMIEHAGESPDALLAQALAADKAVAEGIPPGLTVGLHLCRGNMEGGIWDGSVAPIAERIFNELPHDRFLFEWDDIARDGGYEPIRHVPKGRIMAMGIVSTKTPIVESEDEIVARIDEASKFLDVDQLALCSQCGFASMYGDHLVQAVDAQWRKLELIGKVAERVWGSGPRA